VNLPACADAIQACQSFACITALSPERRAPGTASFCCLCRLAVTMAAVGGGGRRRLAAFRLPRHCNRNLMDKTR
jgi:hypothetical protein